MRHLYLRIYVAIVVVLLLFGALSSLLWWLGPGQDHHHDKLLNGLTLVASRALPRAGESNADTQRVLREFSRETDVVLTLRDPTGVLIANAGPPIELPSPPRPGWAKSFGHGPTLALQLPDRRWLLGRHRPHGHLHGARWLWALVVLAIAVAIGAHPVARRLTRRIERLRQNVDALGAGELSARVEVEGKDEVADLARSFNVAAERIEQLVHSQRSILASASHELRSPLARIRMAVELLDSGGRNELKTRIDDDIAELDGLIDELLTASRLQVVGTEPVHQPVDLLAVVAEECSRFDATFSGAATSVQADPRLMHRLVRNLLQNAARHGGGESVEVEVGSATSGDAIVSVCDRGPGVPEAEKENIFRPFYRPSGMPETGEGVGLGLALVRQITEQYGGCVRCLDRDGGGTCFEVRLRPGSD